MKNSPVVTAFQKLCKLKNIKWVALSVEFNDGGRVTLHSKDAPNRPAGIKS